MKLNGINLASIIQAAKTTAGKVSGGAKSVIKAIQGPEPGTEAHTDLVWGMQYAEAQKIGDVGEIQRLMQELTQRKQRTAFEASMEASPSTKEGTVKPPALNADEDRTPSGNHTRRAA